MLIVYETNCVTNLRNDHSIFGKLVSGWFDLVSSARDNWDHLRDSDQEGELDEYCFTLNLIA